MSKLYLRNNRYRIIALVHGSAAEIKQLKVSRKEVPQWDIISASTYRRELAKIDKRGAK